jgi:hypothetical protein
LRTPPSPLSVVLLPGGEPRGDRTYTRPLYL